MQVDLGKVLALIKALVLGDDYDYGNKVRGFIEIGDFVHDDLERCIATATKIHKAEPDRLKTAMDGMTYTITGRDADGNPFYTCGKIIVTPAGRLYFFITAHAAD